MYPKLIAIGSDHAGYQMKQAIKFVLERRKIDLQDVGPQNEDSVDYPDYAEKVARLVSEESRGKRLRRMMPACATIGASVSSKWKN